MAIYLLYMASPIIVYGVLELILGYSINDNPKYRKIYLGLMVINITLMMGLRSQDVGSEDSRFYYTFWETMSKTNLSELGHSLKAVDLEVGYQCVTWVFSHIFHNGQWQLILSGAFFAISVCLFANKNCKNLFLALTVFNCLGLFNFMVQGLRQAVAMCICLWAIEPCKKRKPLKFILLIFIASLFHGSAVVFSVVYFLKYLKLNIKSYFIAFCSIMLVILLLPELFDLFNLIINDHYESGKQSNEGGVVAIFIYIAIIAFGLLFKDRQDTYYPMFIYMTLIALMAMIMRNMVSSIVERIAYYFAFGEMVVISNSIRTIDNKKEYHLVCGFIVMMCLCVAIYKSTYSVLIPYTFFWQ